MTTSNRILAVFASAMLVGAFLGPAAAIDLKLNDGSIKVLAGAAGAVVTLGGGEDIATAGVVATKNVAVVSLTNKPGSLVDVGRKNRSTSAKVNLGGLTDLDALDGINLDDIALDQISGIGLGGLVNPPANPPGAAGRALPTDFGGAYASLSSDEQYLLKAKCRSVLFNPVVFDDDLVRLCRLIARIEPLG